MKIVALNYYYNYNTTGNANIITGSGQTKSNCSIKEFIITAGNVLVNNESTDHSIQYLGNYQCYTNGIVLNIPL